MSQSFENAVVPGEYILLNKLGSGGQAEVYKAQPIGTTDQNVYAAKIFWDNGPSEDSYLEEGRIAMGLPPHENLLKVHEYGKKTIQTQEGNRQQRIVIVSDFASGGSLAELDPFKVPIVRRVTMLAMAARGLGVAHKANVVHHDVKLPNLLLTDGYVKVADFGIASTVLRHTHNPTTEAFFKGTLPYSAPEQILGKTTAWSDQYGLGVAQYRLLTGKYPFVPPGSGSLGDWLGIHRDPNRQPPEFSTLLGDRMNDTYGALEPVACKALMVDPKKRYDDMDDYREALEDAYRKGFETTQRAKRYFTSGAETRAVPSATRPYTRESEQGDSSGPANNPGRRAVTRMLLVGVGVGSFLREGQVYNKEHKERGALRELYKDNTSYTNTLSIADHLVTKGRGPGENAELIADIGFMIADTYKLYRKVDSSDYARKFSEILLHEGDFEAAALIGVGLNGNMNWLRSLEILFRLQQELARSLESPLPNPVLQQRRIRTLRECESQLAIAIGSNLPRHLKESAGTTDGNGHHIAVPPFDTATQSLLEYPPYDDSYFATVTKRMIDAKGDKALHLIASLLADEAPSVLTQYIEKFNVGKASPSTIHNVTLACRHLGQTQPTAVQDLITRLHAANRQEDAQLLSVLAACYMPDYAKKILQQEMQEKHMSDFGVAMALSQVYIAPHITKQVLEHMPKDKRAQWLDYALHASNTKGAMQKLVAGQRLDKTSYLLFMGLVSGQSVKPKRLSIFSLFSLF